MVIFGSGVDMLILPRFQYSLGLSLSSLLNVYVLWLLMLTVQASSINDKQIGIKQNLTGYSQHTLYISYSL